MAAVLVHPFRDRAVTWHQWKSLALVSGMTYQLMRHRLLLLACAVCGASALTTERALAPFTQVHVGSCFPLSVRVAASSGGYSVSVTAPESVQSLLVSTVRDGELFLSVATPGFTTSAALALTVYLPEGQLRSLTHDGGGGVWVSLTPAADFTLVASGQGWADVAAAPLPGGDVTVSLTGQAPVTFCAPQPTRVRSLSLSLSGTADLRTHNLDASQGLTAQLPGMGQLTASGAPSAYASLSLRGSGSISAATDSADVALSGMGDIFVTGADAITGSLSGMGHVYYSPSGTSCTVSGFGMGGCSYGPPPQPRLSCDSHDVDADNRGGWDVQVSPSGSSCQAHKPAMQTLQSIVTSVLA